MKYALRIIGGPFDGAPGLAWIDDGDHPVPSQILVGVCEAGMTCGTTICRRHEAHVSFWTLDEAGQPARTTEYTKQEEHVIREGVEVVDGAVTNEGRLSGVADFAIGHGLVSRELAGVSSLPEPATFAGGRHDWGWMR